MLQGRLSLQWMGEQALGRIPPAPKVETERRMPRDRAGSLMIQFLSLKLGQETGYKLDLGAPTDSDWCPIPVAAA